MTAQEFCYWLQGYFELSGEGISLTPEQVSTIKAHLSLAFIHDIDPKAGNAEYQSKLNQIHNPDGDSIMRC